MSDIVAASVSCRGTAIDIRTSRSTRRLRGIDLGRRIGRIAPGDLVAVSVDGGDLDIELASGAIERVNVANLDGDSTLVVRGARLATCDGPPDAPLGLVEDAAVVAGGGVILWHGPTSELDGSGVALEGAHVIEARGRLLTPGLIDCHTHPLFGGNRADEFAMRARGASYHEIAASGGGIAATLEPTRAASFEDHVAATTDRVERALAGGTTTLEAKSGYDLTVDGELRLLEVASVVDSLHPVDLVGTLLGAHLVPPERSGDRSAYVADVVNTMIPRAAAASLCTSVDVYCDEGAFTLDEARQVLEAARRHDLGVRAHVGQFADLGGAELCAELGALSADHLEEISPGGIKALAGAGVVAVMLPSACVQLKQSPPPVDAFRRAGVAMAVATDMNPGSSFCETLAVPMWLATTRYGMTVEEAWLGVTRYAARALGRVDIGTITIGAAADLVLWDGDTPAVVPYRFGSPLALEVIKRGRVVFRR